MVDGHDLSVRAEIRCSGAGGQGILLVAAIIAEAATELGKQVVQTQSYGPAARGGASKSEVIISNEEIDYPEVLSPDVNLCLAPGAYRAYVTDMRPGGLLVYDSDLVQPGPESREVDAVRRAVHARGRGGAEEEGRDQHRVPRRPRGVRRHPAGLRRRGGRGEVACRRSSAS